MILCFRSQGYKTFDKKNSFLFLEIKKKKKLLLSKQQLSNTFPRETLVPERQQSRPLPPTELPRELACGLQVPLYNIWKLLGTHWGSRSVCCTRAGGLFGKPPSEEESSCRIPGARRRPLSRTVTSPTSLLLRTVASYCFLSFDPSSKRSTHGELWQTSVCPNVTAKEGTCRTEERESQWAQRGVTW